MKRLTPITIAAVAALALAGCSAGVDSSANTDELSGDPITIMVFGSFSQPPFPLAQIKTGAEAAVARVNADGGVNGSPLELVSCDDEGSANGATACGRQAVNDNVVAVVGTFTLFGDAVVPQLEAANIPYIGNVAISAQESMSTVSFPVMSAGGPNLAAAVSLKEQGCTSIALAAPDSAASQGSNEAFGQPVAKAVGIPITFVPYPGTTTDFSSVAARVADVASCVIYGGGPQDSAALITALNQTGGEFIHMALSTIAFPESSLAQFGEAANGIQVLSPFAFPSSDSTVMTQAVADMKAIDSAVSIDETAVNAYAAVLTFAQAAGEITAPVTGSAIIELLNTPGTTIDTGLFGATDFASDAGFFPQIPRLAGHLYQPYVAKDGVFVPNGDPVELAGIF